MASVHAHFFIFAARSGVVRSKNIGRMGQASMDAYAQYRPSVIHKGRKPRG